MLHFAVIRLWQDILNQKGKKSLKVKIHCLNEVSYLSWKAITTPNFFFNYSLVLGIYFNYFFSICVVLDCLSADTGKLQPETFLSGGVLLMLDDNAQWNNENVQKVSRRLTKSETCFVNLKTPKWIKNICALHLFFYCLSGDKTPD